MMVSTENRPRALVTGASAGIGAAFARRLARDGYDLVLVARRRERLEALAQGLEDEYGARAEVVVADLADVKDLEAVEAVAATGLRLLVNNAGFGGYKPFLTLDPQMAEDLLRVHVLASTRLTRATLPAMVEQEGGAVVNVASLLALTGSLPPVPLPHRVTYAAAKAYLVAFTQTLHHELEGTDVQLQVLCPGLVRTEFHEVAGVDRSQFPFPPMEPEEVVNASLVGLQSREVVCVPGLEDAALLEEVWHSQRQVFQNAAPGPLASRYADA
jgi:short-subunit dehydrogenase